MKIRKVNQKDLENLVQLYDGFLDYLWQFAKFVKDKNSKRDDKTKIQNALKKRINNKNKNIFLVAEESGKLLGFAEARIMPTKESKTKKIVVEMVDIYVAPKIKGVGKKLFREVEKWAKLKKAKFISWEFLHGNKRAERFCIKNKFKHFRVEMLKKLK